MRKTIPLYVKQTNIIADIKSKLFDKENIPIEE